MKGKLILLFISLLPGLATANMSNPEVPGTLGASAFCASYVDILSESIRIILDGKGMNARYEIEYHLRSDSSGVQVPLLFYAYDLDYPGKFEEHFQVWIDGQPIETFPVPEGLLKVEGSAWAAFDQVFHLHQDAYPHDATRRMVVDLPASESEAARTISISDLRYFEPDIARGEHTIRVTYSARHWEYRLGYIKDISFRYALSPARKWRSFGELEITLDARACDSMTIGDIQTNLGPPASGDTRSVATWKFSAIPVSVMEVALAPRLTAKTRFLLRQGPFAFLIGGTALVFLLQFFFNWLYRRKYTRWKISWVNFLGSSIGLVAILVIFLKSPDWISAGIPADFRGWGDPYLIFAIVLFPLPSFLFCVLYFSLNQVIDWRLRIRFRRKKAERSA